MILGNNNTFGKCISAFAICQGHGLFQGSRVTCCAVCSRRGTHRLLYSENDNVFEFSWKERLKNEGEIYRCKNCDKARRRNPDEYGTVPSIRDFKDVITNDPIYPQHQHFCVEAGFNVATGKAKAVRRALKEC